MAKLIWSMLSKVMLIAAAYAAYVGCGIDLMDYWGQLTTEPRVFLIAAFVLGTLAVLGAIVLVVDDLVMKIENDNINNLFMMPEKTDEQE